MRFVFIALAPSGEKRTRCLRPPVTQFLDHASIRTNERSFSKRDRSGGLKVLRKSFIRGELKTLTYNEFRD
jgi:hypothetical protein